MHCSLLCRLLEKIDKSGDCWIWTGSKKGRYAGIVIDGKLAYAHRVAWELHNGPIPDGMSVCHRCGESRCVNPRHLELKQIGGGGNAASKKSQKGTPRVAATKLTEDQVREIRRLFDTGDFSKRKLARMFGVSRPHIVNIVTRKSWKQVEETT